MNYNIANRRIPIILELFSDGKIVFDDVILLDCNNIMDSVTNSIPIGMVIGYSDFSGIYHIIDGNKRISTIVELFTKPYHLNLKSNQFFSGLANSEYEINTVDLLDSKQLFLYYKKFGENENYLKYFNIGNIIADYTIPFMDIRIKNEEEINVIKKKINLK